MGRRRTVDYEAGFGLIVAMSAAEVFIAASAAGDGNAHDRLKPALFGWKGRNAFGTDERAKADEHRRLSPGLAGEQLCKLARGSLRTAGSQTDR